MTDSLFPQVELLRAVDFAADKHRDQRRKDADRSPYINHPIAVAKLLAQVGGLSDLLTLQAAILHDTIEDTKTTPDELEKEFGVEVRDLVVEVTDDKLLPKAERKRLQIKHAPHLSERARVIKIADKICNILDITHSPPTDWALERRVEYINWAGNVVAGCRGVNERIERRFDEVMERARRVNDLECVLDSFV
jgi:guanosine-3',5'-bis(diphosphate) 3'-pyrophosphohydrolase